MAQGSNRKGRQAGVATDDPVQSARFIEAARGMGIEEVGEAYDRALDRILAAPKPIEAMSRSTGELGQKKKGRPRKVKPY